MNWMFWELEKVAAYVSYTNQHETRNYTKDGVTGAQISKLHLCCESWQTQSLKGTSLIYVSPKMCVLSS